MQRYRHPGFAKMVKRLAAFVERHPQVDYMASVLRQYRDDGYLSPKQCEAVERWLKRDAQRNRKPS